MEFALIVIATLVVFGVLFLLEHYCTITNARTALMYEEYKYNAMCDQRMEQDALKHPKHPDCE